MDNPPKYSLPEIERRWLIDADQLPELGMLPSSRITDKYLEGSRLRLRKLETGSDTIYKLCKKYEVPAGDIQPITNIYLTATEHALLDRLPGRERTKTRYHPAEGGAIDRYQSSTGDLLLFSAEFDSVEERNYYAPPEYAGVEVTDDEAFSGFALAIAGTRSE
jgi:CYTH domain-containing protein